jgi:quercetin dioxygenase-like cupin family protein
MGQAETVGRGVKAASLYPAAGAAGGALVAVDVWELQPGASLAAQAHPEEQVVYVLAGEGRMTGEGGGAEVRVRPDTCVYVGAGERVSLQNVGKEVLRVLVTTPMLVRSSRAAGIGAGGRLGVGGDGGGDGDGARGAQEAADRQPPVGAARVAERAQETVAEDAPEVEEAPPNIEGMMRKASELKGQPKPERRRPPQPAPEPEPPAQEAQPEVEEEEEEEEASRMELLVAFDAGTRGGADGTGEGFGRYMVQAPGRKPAIRRVELGDDFTAIQAEYQVLIECLSYVAERLRATGRSPEGVQLDIRSNNEQVVNQLLGTMKIREPNIRKEHAEATSLLEEFAEWSIAWEKPEGMARMFGG